MKMYKAIEYEEQIVAETNYRIKVVDLSLDYNNFYITSTRHNF